MSKIKKEIIPNGLATYNDPDKPLMYYGSYTEIVNETRERVALVSKRYDPSVFVASKDLLDALENAIKQMRQLGMGASFRGMDYAEQAIAKARGKEAEQNGKL